MEKRTNLFGWDITPRRELWQEIDRLYKQLEIQECHLADKQKENDKLRQAGDTVRAQLKNLDVRNTQLLAEKADCMKDCERLTELNDGLTAQNRSLTAQLSELHKQLEEAQEALRRTNGDTIRLTRENAELRRTSCKQRTNTKKQSS